VQFESEAIPNDGTPAGATLALNRWLEGALVRDEPLCLNWLWAHDRWRHQDVPARRFRLESKRDLLSADVAARKLAALPRRTRFWIRLPNWLGDVIMAAPLLRALRESRPDAEITVLGREGFQPLVGQWRFIDRFIALPPRGAGYFPAFARLRGEFPDVWVAFTQSVRGDLEGVLAGAPQRFGVVRPGRPRPLLTHAFGTGPADPARHQFSDWEAFFRHFGLEGPVSTAPLAPPPERSETLPIGLIAGSENNPEKRWPVPRWRQLIEALPGESFILFGTAGDRPLADAIAAGFGGERVENLAGQTDLARYIERLRACRAVVCNDTGGMHLANSLAVPVVGLFGPTNPQRTGPIFSAARAILQPPHCPAAGGSPLAELEPECVLTALRALGKTAAPP
jgi:ADP-heptose:LPS heptosyltransferase